MKRTITALFGFLLLATPAAVEGQSGSGNGFDYTINPDDTNTITITNYTGPGGAVIIPTNINGFTVTRIGNGEASVFSAFSLSSVTIPGSVTEIGAGAFDGCADLSSVTMANGVTNIEDYAFSGTSLSNMTIPPSVIEIGNAAFENCFSMRGLYFTGNAPAVASDAFAGNITMVYYLPGTTGWSNTFGTRPAFLWNPLIQTGDGSFGISNNQFGFNISGTTNIPIMVEACTNLASPVWIPLTNVTLTNGLYYFSDPKWTNHSSRFYGLGFQ
jgi:hypothetical protein